MIKTAQMRARPTGHIEVGSSKSGAAARVWTVAVRRAKLCHSGYATRRHRLPALLQIAIVISCAASGTQALADQRSLERIESQLSGAVETLATGRVTVQCLFAKQNWYEELQGDVYSSINGDRAIAGLIASLSDREIIQLQAYIEAKISGRVNSLLNNGLDSACYGLPVIAGPTGKPIEAGISP